MDPLIGTRNCPHLGYESREGRPCCHADDSVRSRCSHPIANPAAQGATAALGLATHFCTVLGKEHVPAEALKRAARQKAEAAHAKPPRAGGYRPPRAVTGHVEPKPSREPDLDADQPVIPTHTLRNETQRPGPNTPCPCGSGRKYKKCCGRK